MRYVFGENYDNKLDTIKYQSRTLYTAYIASIFGKLLCFDMSLGFYVPGGTKFTRLTEVIEDNLRTAGTNVILGAQHRNLDGSCKLYLMNLLYGVEGVVPFKSTHVPPDDPEESEKLLDEFVEKRFFGESQDVVEKLGAQIYRYDAWKYERFLKNLGLNL